MQPKEILKNYLANNHVMQLATAKDNKPWSASVYYITDDHGNLYWASIPSRRHSQEIVNNQNVSCAIAVQSDIDRNVAGIQIEGLAQQIEGVEKIRPIAIQYAQKFKMTKGWIEKFAAGKTEHCLYQLTPTKYVLFDESNFPQNPQHEFYKL